MIKHRHRHHHHKMIVTQAPVKGRHKMSRMIRNKCQLSRSNTATATVYRHQVTANVVSNEFEFLNKIFIYYHIAGKFGEFDELSVICQTKTIQISSYN